MLQIAHRGDSHFHEDNSRQAFMSAIDKKFDMIELDIQLSQDDIIFVYHDTMIHEKILETLTIQEIKALNPSIITLTEFFQLDNMLDFKIYLDIKGNTTRICPILDNFLENMKNISREKIYLASFNLLIIHELSKNTKTNNYQCGIILENLFTIPMFRQLLQEYPSLSFICFHWTMLNQEMIDFLKKEYCLQIYTYTCKNDDLLHYMQQFKIDGIVTNYKF